MWHGLYVCLFVCVSVCVLFTRMCCAKMAELIEILFGGWYLCPRNHVLDGVNIPHNNGQFWGLSGPLKGIGSLCCGVGSKREEIIQLSVKACSRRMIMADWSVSHYVVPPHEKPFQCNVAFCQNSLTTSYSWYCCLLLVNLVKDNKATVTSAGDYHQTAAMAGAAVGSLLGLILVIVAIFVVIFKM